MWHSSAGEVGALVVGGLVLCGLVVGGLVGCGLVVGRVVGGGVDGGVGFGVCGGEGGGPHGGGGTCHGAVDVSRASRHSTCVSTVLCSLGV